MKICPDCKNEFQPNSGRHLRCVNCSTIRNKQNQKDWRTSHPDRSHGWTKSSPEYMTVVNHYRLIFQPNRKQHENYKGMPFCDTWNPKTDGSFQTGAAWIISNLGIRPNGGSLHIVDHEKGFVPGNLEWATRRTQNREQLCKIVARQSHNIKELERMIYDLVAGENGLIYQPYRTNGSN